MPTRKQQLLRRHRHNKRLTMVLLVTILIVLLALAWWYGGWWWLAPPVLALSFWIGHEAWFSDHLFYSPRQDYRYDLSQADYERGCRYLEGVLSLDQAMELPADTDTLLLQVVLDTSLAGRLLDPCIRIEGAQGGSDQQYFERGSRGVRYLNLSGFLADLRTGQLHLTARHCRVVQANRLYAFCNPDYSRQRLLVIAPHPDDAELAAFGVYSRAPEVSVITLTQGEIEAWPYRSLGLNAAEAARLKGRLRTWDSMAIPLWGNVSPARRFQLGYYCMRLQTMWSDRQQSFGSLESGECDVRTVRHLNPCALPADRAGGAPTGRNLLEDLRVLLERLQPQVIVLPHPIMDPHPDHRAATQFVTLAAEVLHHPPVWLYYANHLHDNDLWPMGPTGYGIALPPAFQPMPACSLWTPVLERGVCINKSLALAMQHDLQRRPPLKKRLRRCLQWMLAGRRWPTLDSDEFQRKAVRRHELFWVCRQPLEQKDTAQETS